MRNQRFIIHDFGGRLVSLTVFFSLLLILVFGPASSSSLFTHQNNAFAADMPGGSMGGGGEVTEDTITAGPSDDGGQDDDHDGDGTITEDTITAGGEPDNDNDNDDNDNDDNNDRDNQVGQVGSTGPKAIEIGKCDPGFTYDDFGDCVAVITGDPRNSAVAAFTPAVCLVSYSPYHNGPTNLLERNKDNKFPLHSLEYTTLQPSMTRGLHQGIEPHIHLVGDPFLDFDPSCKSAIIKDPNTNIETQTLVDKNGMKSVAQRDASGVTFSQNKFGKDGSLISSQVGSDLPDPNTANAAVNIHKNGKKDVTIALGTTPITKFTIAKSGKITPSNPNLQVKEFFNFPGYQRSSSTIYDTPNGVTVDVYSGSAEAPGFKTIKATKSDNSPLLHVAMDPQGALSLVSTPSTIQPVDPSLSSDSLADSMVGKPRDAPTPPPPITQPATPPRK